MSDLCRCVIKSIVSPGDFWMTKYCEEKNEVDELEDKLSKLVRFSKYTCNKTDIGTGEVVAVQHPDHKDLYLRGRVKKIFVRNGKYAYEVFLLDHGIYLDVEKSKIEIIANSIIRNKEAAAFKVHLYGVQPIQPNDIEILELGGTGFKWEVSKTWVPSALGFVKKEFEKHDEIYLKCRNIVHGVVVADIYIKESIAGSLESLADLLIDNKFGIKKEGISLTSSKIAPSSSDGDLSINETPVDLIEIQEVQAKLELVNKWRMEHVAVNSASKSELDDTWDDENDLLDSPEKKIEEKKPKRPDTFKLLERLKKQQSAAVNHKSDSVSCGSTSPSANSCSNVSSRSYELLKRLSAKRSKSRSLCSDRTSEEDSKIKIVVNCNDDFHEDDKDGFDFEEPMPLKPEIDRRLEPELLNSLREEARSTGGFKVMPAGRIDPDLPKVIKKESVKQYLL